MKPIAAFPSARKGDLDSGAILRPKALLTDYHFQISAFGPYGRPAPGHNNGKSSIRLISRDFFRGEIKREFFVEAIVFLTIVLISAWPITYMLQILSGMIK